MSDYESRPETAIEHDYPGFPSREIWEPIQESPYKPASGTLAQMSNITVYGETGTDPNAPQSIETDPNKLWIRSSTKSVLSIRALLHLNFKLPAEIITDILDHAGLWVCTENTKHVTETESNWVSHYPLMVTTPIGQIKACQSPDEKWLKATVLGSRFRCKRIIVTLRAQAIPMVMATPGRHLKPPGRDPLIMAVLWEGLPRDKHWIPQEKGRDQIFSDKNLNTVLEYRGSNWSGGAGNHRRWSVPVIEEPLNPDVMEEREVVWSWTDDTPGGDVVRALGAGDKLQLAMNYRSMNWGSKYSFLRVRVYHTA